MLRRQLQQLRFALAVLPLCLAVQQLLSGAHAVRDASGALSAQHRLQQSNWGIKTSRALGVSHCSLPGVLGGEQVVLHLWMRFVPPWARRNRTGKDDMRAAVRGFALLQSNKSIPQDGAGQGAQLLQAEAILWFSDQVYLWSSATKHRYSMPLTHQWHPNPPKHSSAAEAKPTEASTTTLPVIPPAAPRAANDSSTTGGAAQARNRLLLNGQGRPAQALSSGGTAHGKRDLLHRATRASSGTGAHAMHMQAGKTLPPPPPRVKRIYTSNHVMEFHGDLELLPGDLEAFDFQLRAVGLDWHCPLLIEPPTLDQHTREPAPGPGGASRATWSHVDHSSLSNSTEAVFLLSPYHATGRVNLTTFAHLLWHHATWHEALGISSYVLYADWGLTELMREPLIRALVEQGRLQVVLWVDLPKHEQVPFQPTRIDLYLMQVLIYNHALLSLWGTDTLVLVADLDEYMLTPRPMSAVEVFRLCEPNIPAVAGKRAGVQIRRVFAMCVPSQGKCTMPYYPLFASGPEGGNNNSSARPALPHPLSHFTMASQLTTGWQQDIKAFVEPNLVRELSVHYASGVKGTHVVNADASCARFLHLWELFKMRRPYGGLQPSPRSTVANWWWPERAMDQNSALLQHFAGAATPQAAA